MALYRVMVSAKREYWQWVEVDAESKQEAVTKAFKKFRTEDSHSSNILDLQCEAVEKLDPIPTKTSDEAWIGEKHGTD